MSPAASHPNLDVVNRVYEAMAAGDRQTLYDLHHPDVVLHVSGDGRQPGTTSDATGSSGSAVSPTADRTPPTTP